jgi:DNA-binding MarR family transcriptional regulator
MISRKRFDAEGYPDHILRWLDGATRRIAAEMEREALRAAEAGRPYLSTAARPSQRRVLSMIGTGGVRITDLAHLAGMTKQAVGELVDSLERDGLATSEQDPNDRRVRLVRRTPLGTRSVEEASSLIAAAERRVRRQVGAARYDEMVQVLREVTQGGSR